MQDSPPWRMIDIFSCPLERLDELHEKYSLSNIREAEEMCNYSQYLVQKGIKEGKEEQKLDFLKQLEAFHYGDKRIMQLLQVDICQLKHLREMLHEKRTVVMAD